MLMMLTKIIMINTYNIQYYNKCNENDSCNESKRDSDKNNNSDCVNDKDNDNGNRYKMIIALSYQNA